MKEGGPVKSAVETRGANPSRRFERKAVMYSHEYVGTDEERALFLEKCTSAKAREQSRAANAQFLSDRKHAAGGVGG